MQTSCRSEPSRLIVVFPLAALLQDQRIVDPENTQFIAQFYLLENISRGLVRDSADSPEGYAPGIARSWTRLSSKRWALDIDPDARWSDGTPITAAQVASHLERLSRGRHRHVVYLKNLSSIRGVGHRLELTFRTQTNAGLIHELSLADTFMLHPRNWEGDWSIGSGPFVVEKYVPGEILALRSNARFPDSAAFPEHVDLIEIPWEARPAMFKDRRVDLYRTPGPHFARSNQPVFAAAPKAYRGYPTSIYYFAFKPGRWLDKSVAARREIASLLMSSLQGIRLPEMSAESQMVPKGFAGRLADDIVLPPRSTSAKVPEALSIGLPPAFQTVPQVADSIVRTFARRGVSVTVTFEGDRSADINLCAFIGNQRDALGSWRFLLSPDHGELRAALPGVRRFLERAASTDDPSTRDEMLLKIHRTVLADAYAVPAFIEPNVFLHSRRVDPSRISRFDMRLRFYDVRWQ